MRSKLLTTLIDTLPRPHTPLHLRSTTSPTCTHLHNLSPLLQPTHSHRTFTTTPHPHKKGGKQDSKRTVPSNAQKPSSSKDPFDFADYTTAIARTTTTLKTDLASIKPGGLNPNAIETIRVNLVKGEKHPHTTVKIGDVASVIVRGRNVAVVVGEKDVRTTSLLQLLPIHPSIHPSSTLHPNRSNSLTLHEKIGTAPQTHPLIPPIPAFESEPHLLTHGSAHAVDPHSAHDAGVAARGAGGRGEEGGGGAVCVEGGEGGAAEEASGDGVGEAGWAGRAEAGGEGGREGEWGGGGGGEAGGGGV